MIDLDDVVLHGDDRSRVLADIKDQLDAWGITMPPCEPIPLHFGINKFSEIGETEFWIANETEHGYCGKFLFVFDGQTCPYHEHKVKHETFYVLKGRVRMIIGDEERILDSGEVLVMPVGTGHSFTGLGPALILEVSKPSVPGDSYFSDSRIGGNGVI